MGLNLATVLTESARLAPDHRALVFMGHAISYAQVDEASARAAALFRSRGLERGDRVVLMLPNVPDFVTAYYGALRAGLTAVPVSPLLKAGELAFILEDCEAKALVAWEDFLEEARPAAERAGVADVWASTRPDGDTQGLPAFPAAVWSCDPLADVVQTEPGDLAVVLYTSGTTGRPKGAALTHSNMVMNAFAAGGVTRLQPGDVLVAALPLFHSFAQTCVLNVGFKEGASVILIPRFEPEAVLDAIESERATVFAGVPAMYAALLGADTAGERDKSSLRYCLTGGSGMPTELTRDVEERFGWPVYEGYGLSETSPLACCQPVGEPKREGSIGTSVWGVEMKIVDDDMVELPPGEVGEVAIRGHCVMQGYLNRPDATAEAISPDGWFRSGDLGRVDEDGHFYIVDRKKELIIRGGENVYPREVEECLHEHPAVAFAAVIGIPDERLGEEIAAVVQPKHGQAIDPEELKGFVKERLAAFKYPRFVAVVDELPLGPSGKVLKRQIDRDAVLAVSAATAGSS